MVQDSNKPSDRQTPQGPGRISPRDPSRPAVQMPKAERPQTFTKVFRWQLPAGQTKEPATVEVVGTFTKGRKIPLLRDAARRTWEVTLHDITCNRAHRYMLLADGKPVRDEQCDGLILPGNAREAQYALKTEQGPRVFILFAQTK